MNLFLQTAWPYLATASLVALTGFYAWRQPNRSGTRYFYWFILLWLVMSVTAAFTTVVKNNTEMQFWLWVLMGILMMSANSSHLMFSLMYTGNEKWLKPGIRTLLFLPAIGFGLLSLILPMDSIVSIETHRGYDVILLNDLTKWIFIAFFFIIWIINVGVLGGNLLRAPAFKVPVSIIILGQAIPLFAYFAIDFSHIPVSPVQVIILFTSITALAYIVALTNFRFLRVVPVAWDEAISHIPNGIIVLDAENFLVAFNSASQMLPGLSNKLVLRQSAAKSLGLWWERIVPLINPERVSREIVIQTNSGHQYFQVHSLPLQHVSGWRMGQVFIFEDITQARKSQELQAQTLWAQAILHEREQLAYELHDGLFQNLAFLNMQAQAAQIQIRAGQSQSAQASLDRLIEAADQIQENTREQIDNLLTISHEAENFCETLQQVLTHFKQQTGRLVHLEVDGKIVEDDCITPARLPPNVAIQLVRITQEALTNVRKHTLATCQVWVVLKASEGYLTLSIQDDGAGFDPGTQHNGEKRFGLQIMLRRATNIGGRVTIDSSPGQGTRIEIYVPLLEREKVGGQ